MEEKYLFCIDAGFANTGMSLFRIKPNSMGKLEFIKCFTARTKKSDKKRSIRVADDDSERVLQIIRQVDDFIRPFDGNKIMVAIELPTGGAQGARANRTMGLITGAMVTYLEIMDWTVEYVTPNDVKIAVTKSRKASKDEIMDEIRKMLKKHSNKLPKTKAEFEHIADSVGVALHIKKNSNLYKTFI